MRGQILCNGCENKRQDTKNKCRTFCFFVLSLIASKVLATADSGGARECLEAGVGLGLGLRIISATAEILVGRNSLLGTKLFASRSRLDYQICQKESWLVYRKNTNHGATKIRPIPYLEG